MVGLKPFPLWYGSNSGTFIIESWWDWNSGSWGGRSGGQAFIIESWWDWNAAREMPCRHMSLVYNRIMVGLKHSDWFWDNTIIRVYNRIMVGLKRLARCRQRAERLVYNRIMVGLKPKKHFAGAGKMVWFIIESWWDWNKMEKLKPWQNPEVYNRIMVGLKHWCCFPHFSNIISL